MQSLCSAPEKSRQVDLVLEQYRKLIFPGAESEKDTWAEQAAKQIAEEAKKAYYLTPLAGRQAKKNLEEASQSKNPEIRKWASEELKKEQVAQHRLAKRLERKGKPLPAGVVKLRT